MSLADAPAGTLLHYDVEATVGGKIAQLGSRLIDGVAKNMADKFFANFAAAATGGATQVGEAIRRPLRAIPVRRRLTRRRRNLGSGG